MDLAAVLARKGIEAPFPIQAFTVPDALQGLDVTGRAPTGSGKTIAFGLAVAAQVEQGGAGLGECVRTQRRVDQPRQRLDVIGPDPIAPHRIEAGRDPKELPITIFRVPDDIDRLRYCEDIEVDRVVFTLPAEKEDKLLPIMDRWAELKHKLGV